MKRAFIVEGHTETEILLSVCKGAEIRRLRLNGVAFPIQKIADRVAAQIELLHRKVDIIYVIVDREGRTITSDQMQQDIISCLTKLGINLSKTIISVPDRCIENWFAPFLDDDLVIHRTQVRAVEGSRGKSVVKSLFKSKNKTYNEQVDAPRLFKVVDPIKLCDVSPSFNKLFSSLDNDCWWKTGSRGN